MPPSELVLLRVKRLLEVLSSLGCSILFLYLKDYLFFLIEAVDIVIEVFPLADHVDFSEIPIIFRGWQRLIAYDLAKPPPVVDF